MVVSFDDQLMEDYLINIIVFGVISWTTLFLLARRIFQKRSFDFCNRLVSTTHAIVGVTLASLSVQDWSNPVSPLASKSSPQQMRTLAVSIAYLIYDLVCSTIGNGVKIDNSVHHLVCIVGGCAGLSYQRCGTEMVAALWITEISTPLLHLREILKELGYKDTDLNLAVDILFAAVFSCARMIGGPYLTYVTLTADNPLVIKMEDYVINILVFGVISWTTLFLLARRLFQNRSFDFCNRLVSTTHAIVAVVLASLSVQNWSSPVSPLASKSSPQQMQAMAVSVAYLIYDLVCSSFDKDVKIDNAIHHLVSIVGLGAGLSYQRCGSEMVAALWITEISSPFLHLRELLKELGYRDTDLNLAVDVLFATVFTCARMIGGPYLTYVTLSANNPLLIKAMAFGLQLVSVFWFYKIARMVMYKVSRRASSTAKKIHSS
ncbi:OLC1v1018067C1 [Oldenlandia corymbosa var. corymbosa]|uniref:OLC1v1018067C1 n=1 Tax=Oldenlandia corymbosa var. corymbosa TaxID=529605 RepID=A0AAV1EAS6_OLDCO|nr:OLC1v1018067C1 [Oldenlandia corymbosa var. corymbosa]